jgi:glycosyltransferase involved in cell wall biosynthesis
VNVPRVVALVPAHDEGDLIGDTVHALAGLPGVTEVVVVDDGSNDDTAARALAAGATVLRIDRRLGKGGAVEGALRRITAADVWLFADGDLGASAGALAPVLDAALMGRADLAVAAFPPQDGGGLGAVKRFAAAAIRVLSGFRATQPLSGQRALTAVALRACRPLASGFGMETGMTIDAARAGLRIEEVAAAGLAHRLTHRDLRGFVHRGRQGLDIARAVGIRALRGRGP